MKHTLISFLLIFNVFLAFSVPNPNKIVVHQNGRKTVFDIEKVDSITFSHMENDEGIDRFVGGDISMLPQYEKHGNTYYDLEGNEIEVLPYFKELGMNCMRVRLFVDPGKASADDKGSGVIQDLDFVTQLGKRIKEAGLHFMLDFHYSDSWADPAKQTIPQSWQNTPTNALYDTVYQYTKRCLAVLVQNDAKPDFIQIGNEVSYGMLWNFGKVYATSDDNWNVFSALLNRASKACREICPDAKIVVHTERSGQPDISLLYYQKLEKYGVDYDIIGLSYYPFWHNDLSTLSNTLKKLEDGFPNKKVQIVETAYYYQYQPDVDHDFSSKWSVTPEGQKKYLSELISELKKHTNVNGLYWWFPEENGNGVISDWVNRGLFDDNTGKALPALYELSSFLK